jgi:hypothetical protein
MGMEAEQLNIQRVKIKVIIDQVLQFTEAMSGVSLYPYQRQFAHRVIESVVENDGEEITALFSRQSGKTEAISNVCAGMAVALPFMANLPQYMHDERVQKFKNGIWIGIFAPVLEQSQTTFARIRGRMASPSAQQILKMPQINVSFQANNGNTVALSNGSFVLSMSASDNSHIESKTFHIILMEECQEISNSKIRKSIHPMGAATNATLVKIGTAYTRRGDFYDAIQRNKRRKNKEGVKNHFEYDYTIAQKYNARYSQYIEKELLRLGEDSDEFRMSYKLEWILERGMFVTPEALETMGADYDPIESYKMAPVAAGIDIAKDSDSTVITILECDPTSATPEGYTNKRILAWLELYGDDYETQFYQARDFLSRFKVTKLCIDSTGPGDPIADRYIMCYPDIQVTAFKFTQQSKSDLYKYLLNDFNARRIIYPASENAKKRREYRKFIQQFVDWEKEYKGEYLVCDHPEEADAHDDYCNSLALGVWAIKEEAMPTIDVASNIFYP